MLLIDYATSGFFWLFIKHVRLLKKNESLLLPFPSFFKHLLHLTVFNKFKGFKNYVVFLLSNILFLPGIRKAVLCSNHFSEVNISELTM